jgi:hypothetical protein
VTIDASSNRINHDTSPSSVYRRNSEESEIFRIDDETRSNQESVIRRDSQDSEMERIDEVITHGSVGTAKSTSTVMRRGNFESEEDEVERMSRRDDDTMSNQDSIIKGDIQGSDI